MRLYYYTTQMVQGIGGSKKWWKVSEPIWIVNKQLLTFSRNCWLVLYLIDKILVGKEITQPLNEVILTWIGN